MKNSKIIFENKLSESGMNELDEMLEDSFDSPIAESSFSYSQENDEKNNNYNKNDELSFIIDDSQKDFDDMTLEEKKNSIKKEFDEDFTLTLANIKEKAFMESSIKGKWCSRLMQEKIKFIRIKEMIEDFDNGLNEIVNKSSGNMSFLEKSRTKREIFENNKDKRMLMRKKDEQEKLVEYLQNLYFIAKDFSYSIGHSIEMLKLERGI